jgi:hypothetical protein
MEGEGCTTSHNLGGEIVFPPDFEIAKQRPLVHSIKVDWGEGKALGSEGVQLQEAYFATSTS